MEDIAKMLLAALAGTTLMTAFSYMVSEQFRKRFQEPLLLEYVMKLCHITTSDRMKNIFAWLLHYFLGFLFVLSYHLLWTCCIEFSWMTAVIFGAVSGIIGIVGWMIIFSLPSKKPKVAFTAYFIQLFVAHVVFAVSVFLCYKTF